MLKQTICRQCNKTFKPSHGRRDKFCSQRCYGDSAKSRVGISNPFFGKVHTEEARGKISDGQTGMHHSVETEFQKGMKAWNYIEDRTKIAWRDKHSLCDLAYTDWRKFVFTRDGFKCKISNRDCAGQLEAHHILPWRDFVELRYEINNGITLCHAHHPRKRAEEKRLSPYFQGLVSVSN